MLILIPCKFYYSPYSCPQIFIHNLLTLQSDLFGKFKLYRDFEFPKSLTVLQIIGLAVNWGLLGMLCLQVCW